MEQNKLGKYTLIEQLGEGGFGWVYKAKNPVGLTVALKVLKPQWSGDSDAIARFRQEALSAGTLFHQRIATIMDMDEANGRMFLVMRYVDGRSLADVLEERRRLPWAEALQGIRQVAEGLAYAHRQGFIHRDIKPGNILMGEEGAVLTDFGLVKAMSTSGMSSKQGMVGTSNYIAPEIWNNRAATPKTDVYSLACVLYEMVTGNKLFKGDSAAAVMKMHVLDGPQLPQSWPEDCPARLGEVLGHGLVAELDGRLGLDEFVVGLESFRTSYTEDGPEETLGGIIEVERSQTPMPEEETEPIEAGPVSVTLGQTQEDEPGSETTENGNPPEKRWLVVGGLTLIVVVIVIIGMVKGITGLIKPDPTLDIVAEATIPAINTVQAEQLLDENLTRTPFQKATMATNPTMFLTSTLRPTYTPEPTIEVRRISRQILTKDNVKSIKLLKEFSGENSFFPNSKYSSFSPSGKLFGRSRSNGSSLLVYDMNSLQLVTEIPIPQWPYFSFSNDDQYVAISQYFHSAVEIWNIEDVQKIADLDISSYNAEVFSLAFSPDSNSIIFSNNVVNSERQPTYNYELISMDILGGGITKRSIPNGIANVIFSSNGTQMAIGGASGMVNILTYPNFGEIQKLTATTQSSIVESFSPQWDRIVTSTKYPGFLENYRIGTRLWRISDGKLLRDFKEINSEDMTVAPNGEFYVVKGNGTASVYNVESDELITTINVKGNPEQIEISPDGTLLRLDSAIYGVVY